MKLENVPTIRDLLDIAPEKQSSVMILKKASCIRLRIDDIVKRFFSFLNISV